MRSSMAALESLISCSALLVGTSVRISCPCVCDPKLTPAFWSSVTCDHDIVRSILEFALPSEEIPPDNSDCNRWRRSSAGRDFNFSVNRSQPFPLALATALAHSAYWHEVKTLQIRLIPSAESVERNRATICSGQKGVGRSISFGQIKIVNGTFSLVAIGNAVEALSSQPSSNVIAI